MTRLVDATEEIRRVNVGGIHHKPGRDQRLRYVFLSPVEEAQLQALEARGVEITAQDVPAARPVPLDELLSRNSS
jgi:PTS system mannose-specific IIB component/fructoselysine and glucoselysine-specific PTS system IIB component